MLNRPSFAAVLVTGRRLRLETEARPHNMLRAVVTSGRKLGGRRPSSWT
jgi:hypothetical protein